MVHPSTGHCWAARHAAAPAASRRQRPQCQLWLARPPRSCCRAGSGRGPPGAGAATLCCCSTWRPGRQLRSQRWVHCARHRAAPRRCFGLLNPAAAGTVVRQGGARDEGEQQSGATAVWWRAGAAGDRRLSRSAADAAGPPPPHRRGACRTSPSCCSWHQQLRPMAAAAPGGLLGRVGQHRRSSPTGAHPAPPLDPAAHLGGGEGTPRGARDGAAAHRKRRPGRRACLGGLGAQIGVAPSP